MSIHGGTSGSGAGEEIPIGVPGPGFDVDDTDDAAAAHATVPPRPRRRPSRRLVAIAVVGVLVLAVGAFVTPRVLEERRVQKADREVAAMEAAAVAVQPLVASYAFPASVDGREYCGRFSFRCGSSPLEPRAAASAAAAGFVPLGLEIGEPTCKDMLAPAAECAAELRYDGQYVGQVTARRDAVSYGTFGQPTQVRVGFADVGVSPAMVTNPEPRPMADSSVARSAAPAQFVAALRCEQKTGAGCLKYALEASTLRSSDATWAQLGRHLVDGDWSMVSGTCVSGSRCVVSADRQLAGDREVRLTASTVPARQGTGSTVRIEVTTVEHVAAP